MAKVSISRDPFARGEVTRRQIERRSGCGWCGNFNAYGKLFVYGWEPDSLYANRGSEDSKAFCCKGCRDEYYG